MSVSRALLALVVCLTATALPAQQNPLVGAWAFQGQGLELRIEFRADGTFTRLVKSLLGAQDSAGAYQLANGLLVLRPQNGMPEQFMVQPQGDQMLVRDAMGNVFTLTRQAPTVTPQAGGAAPGGNTAGFKPKLPLPKVPGGHIIYTRTSVRRLNLPGLGAQEIPLSQLFVMAADGGGKAPFLAPPDLTTVKEARWSPDYQRLVFTSDWQLQLSACQQDVFTVNANGSGLRRVTGNALTGPAPKGYGAVTGVIRVPTANPAQGELGIAPSTVNISAQGGDGVIRHPGDAKDIDVLQRETREKAWTETQMRFFLPKVAAGDQVWLKVWRSRYDGSLIMVQVKPNTINDVGDIEINQGTFHAFRPSVGPSPKYVVGMGSIAGKARNVPDVIGAGGRGDQIGGTDAMTVIDFQNGTLLASLDPLQMNMHFPKDPAVSPDGQTVACSWGQPTTESLALIPLADLAAGRPNFRVALKGQMILPDTVTTFQGTNVSYGNPCWSPDGRLLCAARTQLVSHIVNGDLVVVGSDGSNARQITRLGANALACQPCFSPDGKQIAFTVITGKAGPIKIEDMMTLNIMANIFTVDLATGKLTQLTDDGLSAEPAWGP